MLICLQCHLHSALFASGKLRPRLSKKHLLVSRYVHWINSPSQQAYNALRGKCMQTTNVFEPFSLRKNCCSGLYQFVIKTNDEMTNTMALNTLENINSQQKNGKKRIIHERASINANCSWFLSVLFWKRFVLIHW